MPRVEIGTSNQFLFSMERAVGISDLNYAKHLDSVAMLQILNEARLQFLAHLGFSEANVFGLGLVVADQAVDFRSESFAGDRLLIDVGVNDFNRYGFDISFQVTNSALETVVCQAKTGVVFFDFDQHQIAEVPAALVDLLNRREEKVARSVQNGRYERGTNTTRVSERQSCSVPCCRLISSQRKPIPSKKKLGQASPKRRAL